MNRRRPLLLALGGLAAAAAAAVGITGDGPPIVAEKPTIVAVEPPGFAVKPQPTPTPTPTPSTTKRAVRITYLAFAIPVASVLRATFQRSAAPVSASVGSFSSGRVNWIQLTIPNP